MADLGTPSSQALVWCGIAAAAIVAFVWLVGDAINRAAVRQPVDSGMAYALFVAAFLIVDVALLGALCLCAVRGARFTTRALGLVRPPSLRDALLFGASAWLVAVMAGGAWLAFVAPESVSDANPASQRDTGPPDTDQSRLSDALQASADDAGQTEVRSAPDADPSHQLLGVLQQDPPRRYAMVLLFGICIGAPLLEELLFRGFLMRSVAARFGLRAGIAVSSVLFGLAHLAVVPWLYIPPIAFIGAGLAWLFATTGSVIPGIAVHTFMNSLSSAVALRWGWGIPGLIVGSGLVLAVLLFPYILRPREPKELLSLSTSG